MTTHLDIEVVINESLRTSGISDYHSLQGFEYDLIHALSEKCLFTNVQTIITDDPPCIIIATCDTSNLHDAGQKLTEIWQDWLSYPEFEAHHILYNHHQLSFRFVTSVTTYQLCVTGEIIITEIKQAA